MWVDGEGMDRKKKDLISKEIPKKFYILAARQIGFDVQQINIVYL